MSFDKFKWVDRLVAEPNRRTIVDTTTGEQKTVNIYRDEGEIQEEGTPFSEKNMNGLEDRIAKMFPVKIEDGGTGTTDAENIKGINIGKSLNGKQVNPTSTTTVTAGEGSEIFNDYSTRTFSDEKAVTGNIASGDYSHSEGSCTTAIGDCSHSEGYQTVAEGNYTHAEGGGTKTTADYAHAEGNNTTATGKMSHAEGFSNWAGGESAHAEGSNNSCGATYGHAEGFHCNASSGGLCSHAGGYYTLANNFQRAVGRCNTILAGPTSESDMTGTLFVIGNGTNEGSRGNAFRVDTNGNVYALAQFHSSGAGIAEMFEWKDGNINNEDRRGRFVTLDGEKIRIAEPTDTYILGVIDPTPFIIGDSQSEQWKNTYLKDVFGGKITETIEVPETTNELGNVIPAHTETRYILNSDYNPYEEYISRELRQEFAPITSKGKVVMIDDGTCEINKYCKVGINGVATYSEDNYKVRVLNRIDSTHIYVYIDSVFINN